MERDNYLEKIKNLQDAVEWERNKNQLGKSKLEFRKSDSYNSTGGGSNGSNTGFSWK